MNNKEAGPAPHQKELQPKSEKLLSEATTGGQALVLLGINPTDQDKPVLLLQGEQKTQLFTSATVGISEEHKNRLTTASLNERDEFWKHIPQAERMEKWRTHFNGLLEGYTKDAAKTTEQQFLKNILKREKLEEITADTVYGTFMLGEGKGDIEFFARRIVDKNSIEDIEKNAELIKQLGSIYGFNSAKVGERLTYGIANARHNLDEFVASAQENLNNRAYGADVWKPLAENAAQWQQKQHTGHPQSMQDPNTQPPAERTHPSHIAESEQQISAEYHPLVADADAFSEKDANKSINQDVSFVDAKNGVFGVFDGMGSYKKSGEVANLAAKYISEGLTQTEIAAPNNRAEQYVRAAFTKASEAITNQEHARYQAVLEDIKKLLAGELTDDDFDEMYDGPKRQSSTSRSIRRHFDPAKPDELNIHLRDWIEEQVGGATTASVVKLWQGPNGEGKAIIANVGDSRVYHYTAQDRNLRIVTVDDNSLYDLVGEAKARQFQDAKANGVKRKKDIVGLETITLNHSNPRHRQVWEAHASRSDVFRNAYPWSDDGQVEVPLTEIDDYGMTKYLPLPNVEPNIYHIDLAPLDKLIITSDGIHDQLLTREIADTLDAPDNQRAELAAKALVAFAKKGEAIPGVQSGAPKDDATAVVVNMK